MTSDKIVGITMQGSGNPFGPEEISLLKGGFDEAVAALPTRWGKSAVKTLIAERLLKHAVKGERDRVTLLTSSLLDLQTTVASLIGTEEMRPR